MQEMEWHYMNDYKSILVSINELIKGKQPTIDISELLYRHKCLYLLSKMSSEYQYINKVQKDMERNSICIKESYQMCQSIFKTFESQSVQYAVIKGAILSNVAYGSPFNRYANDIDILINRRDSDVVKKILYDKGFVQGKATKEGIKCFTRKELLFQSALSHQVAPFIKASESSVFPYINIDLNIDIMWGEHNEKVDMQFVLEKTMSTSICGVEVKKLIPEMEFISLCMHHYKDMNSIYLLSDRSLKLKLFLDIYMYIKNCVMDENLLHLFSEQLKVKQYIYYCL